MSAGELDMDDQTKIPLLKEEYMLLERFYEDFDARVLTIKGWSATIAIGAIGVGFYQSEFLWLFAAGASLAFWFLEALWKTFQYCHGDRIERIELAFREDRYTDIKPLQIYSSWATAWDRARVWRQFRGWLTSQPHALTMIIGIGLFVLQHFAGIQMVQGK
jgi:hypothetical protein